MVEEPKAAIKPANKGKFKAKAEAAGKSTAEFASEHKGDKGVLGKEARLAGTLMGMHHKKKEHKAPSNPRAKFYGESKK
jgi:hypothetical protein